MPAVPKQWLEAARGHFPAETDPLIKGLFQRLPKTGVEWSPAERVIWLKAVNAAFDLIYRQDSDGSDEIEIGVRQHFDEETAP